MPRKQLLLIFQDFSFAPLCSMLGWPLAGLLGGLLLGLGGGPAASRTPTREPPVA
nr:hypothetical protein [uncultured Holophaga sp.]